MTPDIELLATFARTNSEDAFAELVKRHVNLVYSAAHRQVGGDAHLAKDVAQTVFSDLARKAGSLARRENLAGWLYTSTHFAAAKIVRTEARRRDREETFMREPVHESVSVAASEAEWENLRPALDAAMHELKEADRDAILLRYFENRPFAEVGAKLGLNENAARMRVERAVEKLRSAFAKRGVRTTAGALGILISAHAVQAAPVGLAVTLSAAALAGTAVSTSTLIAATTKTIAMTTLQKTLVTATVAALAGTGIYQARQAAQLRAQVQTLQQVQSPFAQQVQQLQRERDEATNRLASMSDENESLKKHSNELLKLRNEITMLKRSQAAIQATAANSLPPGAEAKPLADESGRELGAAVVRGDAGAFDKLLAESEAEHRSFGTNQIGLNEEQQRELSLKTFAPINVAFKVIEEAANNGSQPALDALARALQSPEMRGIAVSSLGGLAGNGDAGALEILVHPEQYGALLSTTISALQPAADKGNQPAIDALAAVANNPKDRALWYLTAESLTKAAAAGNLVAIDALINMSSATNQSIQRAVAQGLRGAAANQNAKAAEALHSMGMQ